MSQYLVAVPNVSAPALPCVPGQVAIYRGASGWGCFDEATPCPAGTVLFVAPPSPFPWRFCTPDPGYSTQTYGPNLATPAGQVAAVPTLSTWALGALLVTLAIVGARRLS